LLLVLIDVFAPLLLLFSLFNGFLILIITKVLNANRDSWEKNFPQWVGKCFFFLCDHVNSNIFPDEQVPFLLNFKKGLVKFFLFFVCVLQLNATLAAFRKYVLLECKDAVIGFRYFVSFRAVRDSLLHDEEMYSMYMFFFLSVPFLFFHSRVIINCCFPLGDLKKHIGKEDVKVAVRALTFNCEPWQLKLLEDKPFILHLLSIADTSNTIWDFFLRLAQHPGTIIENERNN
jgi:hypothetical protein